MCVAVVVQALNVTDRASLLDDAFYLAEAGLLPYDTVLSLLSYMGQENHYIPWTTVASHLNKMARLLRKTKAYPYFRVSLYSIGLAARLVIPSQARATFSQPFIVFYQIYKKKKYIL